MAKRNKYVFVGELTTVGRRTRLPRTVSLYPTEIQLRQARALCPEVEERKREQSNCLGVAKRE